MHRRRHSHSHIPTTTNSHPSDPIPHEPNAVPRFSIPPTVKHGRPMQSPRSSGESLQLSDASTDSEAPSTPSTEPQVDGLIDVVKDLPVSEIVFTSPKRRQGAIDDVKDSSASEVELASPKRRRASTTLLAQNSDDIHRLLGDRRTGTQLIEKLCCGGGCCLLETTAPDTSSSDFVPVELPDNAAFRNLGLRLGSLSLDTELTNVVPVPPLVSSFQQVTPSTCQHVTTVTKHPPEFVQPHPPYKVFSAPVFHARELTKPGAEKRTYHFDLDVTDYPNEGGIDFKVGGAIGVCPPNAADVVEDLFDRLGVPRFLRDKPALLSTTGGRWPTIWGEEQPRELVTTRRELLTWCSDLQSHPPTKPLLRLLAEHADAKNEQKILMYLSSAQGQASFCESVVRFPFNVPQLTLDSLRTGPHITVPQLLHAFPSTNPPLDHLLSVLSQLMPRFYSLSNDPHISSARDGLAGRRLIEMAVTIHETPDWRGGTRTGLGSGYMERIAQQFIEAAASGVSPSVLDLRIPIFRGLMSNPLSREFVSDGPMMLIGAGVGMAPFRGFILNRVKNANCANKIWLVQGVRDSMLDEIYSGELGSHEKEIKRVVQSRRPKADKDGRMGSKYVQDEVRAQADIVWFVINALDGRVFVCGSSKGMGEGVEQALVDVAIDKGRMNVEEAKEFWQKKKDGGQYITVGCFMVLSSHYA